MRTSGSGSVGSSMLDHDADFGETGSLGPPALSSMGAAAHTRCPMKPTIPTRPLQGMVTVESPLNALKFDIDDNTNTYQAHARITAMVRNAKGAPSGPAGERSMSMGRPANWTSGAKAACSSCARLSLPGQGPFTLEAKVEDLLAGTTGVIQTPLRTSKNAPGLVATDALVVRPFKGSADKFEADQVLSYEGEALSPVLDPVFRAENRLICRST
jgi:hypothetical protein